MLDYGTGTVERVSYAIHWKEITEKIDYARVITTFIAKKARRLIFFCVMNNTFRNLIYLIICIFFRLIYCLFCLLVKVRKRPQPWSLPRALSNVRDGPDRNNFSQSIQKVIHESILPQIFSSHQGFKYNWLVIIKCMVC